MFLHEFDLTRTNVSNLATTEDINNAVRQLTANVTSSLETATRYLETPFKEYVKIPQDIKLDILERNRLRRRAYATLDPNLRRQANRLTNTIQNKLQIFRNDNWNEKMTDLSTEDNSIWKMAKALRLDNPRHSSPLHGLNGLVEQDEDKGEAFADAMEEQFTENETDIDPERERRIRHAVRNIVENHEEDAIDPTSPTEIDGIIRLLKIKKAPGEDKITNKILKMFRPRHLRILATIFNACFRLRHFPDFWKNSNIIMIRKPGQNALYPQNYRPISLLSCLGKIFERLLLNRLQTACDRLMVIPDIQFGFRPDHTAVQQLTRVVEYAIDGMNHRKSTGLLLLDVSKAFDRVWHDGLIYKMYMTGIPIGLIKIINFFLRGRSFQVKVGRCLSSKREIKAGVPQGSPLSPLLYAIYTHDLPIAANVHVACYADDTALYTKFRNHNGIKIILQRQIDRLLDWFTDWKIKINPGKTQAILLTRRRTDAPDEIEIQDQVIPWTDTVKYLGMTLDKRLTWRHHIAKIITKVNQKVGGLLPMLGRRSKLDIRNKLLIHRQVIRPTMLYACPVFGHAASTHIKRLQTRENRLLRLYTDAPWFVRNAQIKRDLHINSLEQEITKLATSFLQKAEAHSNPLLVQSLNYDPNIATSHRRIKHILIPP